MKNKTIAKKFLLTIGIPSPANTLRWTSAIDALTKVLDKKDRKRGFSEHQIRQKAKKILNPIIHNSGYENVFVIGFKEALKCVF